jgi:hypothetical protein
MFVYSQHPLTYDRLALTPHDDVYDTFLVLILALLLYADWDANAVFYSYLLTTLLIHHISFSIVAPIGDWYDIFLLLSHYYHALLHIQLPSGEISFLLL